MVAPFPTNEIKIQLKHNKSYIVWTFNVVLDTISLDSLREVVMNTWEVFNIKEFHLQMGEVVVRDDELLHQICSRHNNTEIILTVICDCIGFGDYKKENEILKLESMVKIEEAESEYGSYTIDESKWKSQIDHAVMDLMNKKRLYGPITKICEATVREYVSPVLSLAALITEDIIMRAEEKICGLRGNGPVDYIFVYKNFSVVMTEVKNEDIESGIAQNDAQMIAGRQEYKRNLQIHLPEFKQKSKKRKYLEIDISTIPSFGIVSTGEKYIFQKLVESCNNPTTIHKSKVLEINLLSATEELMKQQMMEVVRRIVWILIIQKEKVDEHTDAKRVKHQW